MFLRGYGTQDYSQVNGYKFNGNKFISRSKTTTRYKSGELGKVQGDAVRPWWAMGIYTGFTDYTGSQELLAIGKYIGKDSYANWYEFDKSFYVDDIEILDSSVLSYHFINNRNGPFRIIFTNNDSPCIDTKGYAYIAFTGYAFSNVMHSPAAQEIRPVNVAVRYYIKAK